MGQNSSTHLSLVYADNIEFFPNVSNIILIPDTSFGDTTSKYSTSTTGYDWTKPFPGVAITGHEVHLYMTQDVPIPETIVQNSTTTISSLTFSVPESMSKPYFAFEPMDPSWYICRHIFISTKEQARRAVGEGKGCGFLGDSCHADLIESLTKDWGLADDSAMCSALGFDPIPESCWDSFGHARQDVIGTSACPPSPHPTIAIQSTCSLTYPQRSILQA